MLEKAFPTLDFKGFVELQKLRSGDFFKVFVT